LPASHQRANVDRLREVLNAQGKGEKKNKRCKTTS
jgi:hypothetical protein